MILNTFANTDLPKTLVFFFYISFALIIPYKTINLIKLKMYNMHVRSKLYDTNILKTLVFLSIISFRRVIFFNYFIFRPTSIFISRYYMCNVLISNNYIKVMTKKRYLSLKSFYLTKWLVLQVGFGPLKNSWDRTI